MSEGERLVVEGTQVSVVRSGDIFRVVVGDEEIGTLELVRDGSGFVARTRSGDAVTRPSPWGGAVPARFGSRELAVRALIENGGNDG